jgi:glycosyltransferase involved in cell wall biosynthesis
VSVVIPAWNAERFVAEAVASVFAQSHPVDEIVIVDDGSTDGTAAVCDALAREHASLHVIHQANAGPGRARDVGIAASSGELVALLDADDRWHREKVGLQVDVLLARPDVDAVFTHAQNWFEGVPERGPTSAMAGYIPSAVLFRRAVLERAGGFDAPGPLSDWVPWFLRLRDVCSLEIVPQTLVERRVHDANRGLQHASEAGAYARHVAEAMGRRRAQRKQQPD